MCIGDDRSIDFTDILQYRIRSTLDDMLGITDWSISAAAFPTLTDEEVSEYLDPNGNMPGPEDVFRVDFQRYWKSFSFNIAARAVFIRKFTAKVEGGAFLKHPTPTKLLRPETIGSLLDKYMIYCRARWKRSADPSRVSEEKQTKNAQLAARRSRQQTVRLLSYGLRSLY